MARAKRLRMGVDSTSPSASEEKERIEVLRATVNKYLPDFARAIAEIASRDEPDGTIVLHQDAFAAGYDDDEYTLLGMAVKYAGLSGISVTVIGKSSGDASCGITPVVRTSKLRWSVTDDTAHDLQHLTVLHRR